MKLYENLDINKLPLLGQGTQGKVYKINKEKCIKIFKKDIYCKDELKSLLLSQNDYHFPKLYSYGDNYIIRELINGITLDKFIAHNGFTPDLANKIINLYEAMSYVNFTRLDTALFHIYVDNNEDLRLIDTAKALKKNYIYPHLIIDGLNSLGYKNQFFSYVKVVRPDIFNKWIIYI